MAASRPVAMTSPASPPRLTAAAREERMDKAVAAIKAQWNQATSAITSIGQVVLDTCFDGDAHRVLDGTVPAGPSFAELARRVDTLGIGLSRRMLSVSVRIAAYDHVVRGNHWKVLDVGRKEDLLPLREPTDIAAGARFAVEMGATRENLQQWVAARQEATGKPRKARGITLAGARRAWSRLGRLADETSVERVGRGFQAATRPQQRKVVDEVRTAREALVVLERRLTRMMNTPQAD